MPYLLGFHPQESLVTVLIRHGQVAVAARLDLPPVDSACQVGAHLGDLALQQRVDELVLIAYGVDRDECRALLRGVVESVPVRVVEAIHADGERWWGLLCPERCCDGAGTPYAVDSHPVAAEAVYAGLTALGSRTELEELVEGPPEGDLVALSAQTETELDWLEGALTQATAEDLLVEMLTAALADPAPPDDITCLRLALLVVDLRTRDVAWAMIERAQAPEHVRVWSQVVNRTPEVFAAAPLCLLGIAGWVSGGGALLNCCAERVARISPDYSMGDILTEISARAVPPSVWDEWAAGIWDELAKVPR